MEASVGALTSSSIVCSFSSGRIVRLFRHITVHPESWTFPRNFFKVLLWELFYGYDLL